MFIMGYNKGCKGYMPIKNGEVIYMPDRDGTGPSGQGANIGGLGFQLGHRQGAGCKNGYIRNCIPNSNVTKTQKEETNQQDKICKENTR